MSKNWRFNIGHKVSFLTRLNHNRELELVQPSKKDEDCFVDTFLVIGLDPRDGELCLLVERPDFDPHNYIATAINDYFVTQYNVDSRYKSERCIKLFQSHVYVPSCSKEQEPQVHCSEPGGNRCIICQQWISWASENNLPQGGYACFSCRDTKRWKIDAYLRRLGINPSEVKFK